MTSSEERIARMDGVLGRMNERQARMEERQARLEDLVTLLLDRKADKNELRWLFGILIVVTVALSSAVFGILAAILTKL